MLFGKLIKSYNASPLNMHELKYFSESKAPVPHAATSRRKLKSPYAKVMIKCNLFVSDDILYLGGRLSPSPELSYKQKYPVILPRYHPVTKWINQQHHVHLSHAGTTQVLASVRNVFWSCGVNLRFLNQFQNVFHVNFDAVSNGWQICR